eukprot:11003500-Heterocapsa_arctica.AAC.1
MLLPLPLHELVDVRLVCLCLSACLRGQALFGQGQLLEVYQFQGQPRVLLERLVPGVGGSADLGRQRLERLQSLSGVRAFGSALLQDIVDRVVVDRLQLEDDSVQLDQLLPQLVHAGLVVLLHGRVAVCGRLVRWRLGAASDARHLPLQG